MDDCGGYFTQIDSFELDCILQSADETQGFQYCLKVFVNCFEALMPPPNDQLVIQQETNIDRE